MAHPLHSIDVLQSIASGEPGLAREWANALLAQRDPDAILHLPLDPWFAEPIAARGGHAFEEALCAALTDDPHGQALGLALVASSFGALQDIDRIISVVRSEIIGDGSETDLWRTAFLTPVGGITPVALASAGQSTHPERSWVLPAAVLQLVTGTDELEDAAAAIAHEIGDRVDREPGLLLAILRELGVPSIRDPDGLSPEACARTGARMAGGTSSSIMEPRGSVRRRVQRWVRALVADTPGPAAALLRALYSENRRADTGVVAIAAWLAAFQSSDPLTDVLGRWRGCHLPTLAAARRACADEDAEHIGAAIHAELPGTPALALGLLGGPQSETIAAALLDARLEGHLSDDLPLQCAVPWLEDRIPDLLRTRPSRDAGLALAPWCPTEEVLDTLLRLPVPADPAPRALFVTALACMGDRTVLKPLQELRDMKDTLDPTHAIALASSILQTPI